MPKREGPTREHLPIVRAGTLLMAWEKSASRRSNAAVVGKSEFVARTGEFETASLIVYVRRTVPRQARTSIRCRHAP